MTTHVLPGDSLSEAFTATGIDGDVIVFREAFITGDVTANILDELWDERSNFAAVEHGADPIEYMERVAYELEKLTLVESGSEVCLWFEYELFCQVNMWFCLHLLKDSAASVVRVAPQNSTPDDVWKGFGDHDAAKLKECFDARSTFTSEDIATGESLWNAYRDRDEAALRRLSDYRSPRFPFLQEVCAAAIEIDTRPAMILREIRTEGISGIESIFPEFQKRAGVYGFGDVQVEKILDRL